MTLSNGQFVDQLLHSIQVYCVDKIIIPQLVFNSIRDYIQNDRDPRFLISPIIPMCIDKIEQRVEQIYNTTPVMWFVIALHHRNEGGRWEDMIKYHKKTTNGQMHKNLITADQA